MNNAPKPIPWSTVISVNAGEKLHRLSGAIMHQSLPGEGRADEVLGAFGDQVWGVSPG
jgi:hypothetical protein